MALASAADRLAEAQAAYHDLSIGKAAVEVRNSSGESVRFTMANASRLRAYIDDLRHEVAGTTARRRPAQTDLRTVSGPMDDDLSDPLGPSAPILPASAADLPPAGVAAATGGGAVLGGGAFEGANRFDALATWQPSIRSADAELLPDKPILDARVRDTLRNDAYVAGGATLHKDNIVGSLFLLNAKPETEDSVGRGRRDLGARVPGGGRVQIHALGGIAVRVSWLLRFGGIGRVEGPVRVRRSGRRGPRATGLRCDAGRRRVTARHSGSSCPPRSPPSPSRRDGRRPRSPPGRSAKFFRP